MRQSSSTTEEWIAERPGIGGMRVLTYVVFAVLVFLITVLRVLTKERVVVALPLEASDEIPKGSSVVHVVERSHDG